MRLLAAAAAQPTNQQEAYLRRACGDDAALAEAALRMLRASPRSPAPSAIASDRTDVRAGSETATASDRPEMIGPYRILELLGEGGMGTVHLAEQREPIRRRVAVKVIKAGMDSKAVLARFEAERKALALMDHTNIAAIHDCGMTAEGRPYFVMEHVKGVPITEYCDRNRLPLEERLALFRQVCSGVQHAHMKGVMHRDLKPGNILVSVTDGHPTAKIIDFGLAKATDHRLIEQTLFTEHGQIVGTPEYMSPEQAGLGNMDVDTRTDVYSLGVILYHLLVGELPFPRAQLLAHGYLEMQRIIREVEPARPSTKLTTLGESGAAHAKACRLETQTLRRRLVGGADWIVLKALEKDRTRRYQTPLELAADLERYLRMEPVLAGPPSRWYRLRMFGRRNRTGVLVAATVLAGTALGLWAFVGQYTRAQSYLRRLERVGERIQEATLLERGVQQLVEQWTPTEANRPAILEWLATANRLREHTLPSATDAERGSADPLQLLESRLRQQVEGLAGAVGQAQQRIDILNHLRDRLPETQAAWAKHAATPGAELAGRPDLVPLGIDPDSGRAEFALLTSGEAPRRDGNGRLAAPAEAHAIVLVLLPGGTATIGCQSAHPEQTHYDPGAIPEKESPPVSLELAPFLIGKHEVTQAQWLRVMRHNPATWGQSGPLAPVEKVSLRDTRAFLTAIGAQLPTEAQWEYACRGGASSPWWSGSTKESLLGRANLVDKSAWEAGARWESTRALQEWPDLDDTFPVTAPIGSFLPNRFGLHDVAGNVFELAADDWTESQSGERSPGDGRRLGGSPKQGAYRGGSFRSSWSELRSAARFYIDKEARQDMVGLRVALPLATP